MLKKVLFGLTVFVLVMLIATGCLGTVFSGLREEVVNNTRTFNSFTGQQTVIPIEETAKLRIRLITINSINGIPIFWQIATHENPNNYGILSEIPAGTHTFYISYLDMNIWSRDRNTTTLTITPIPINKPLTIDFIAGHTYDLIAAGGNILISDVTYEPIWRFGDDVEIAPRNNNRPTIFEGNWTDGNINNITFKGNNWEGTFQQPFGRAFSEIWTSDNSGLFTPSGNMWNPVPPQQPSISMRGTFTFTEDILILHILNTKRGNQWVDTSSIRGARIYNYKMNDICTMMELSGAIPLTVFNKR